MKTTITIASIILAFAMSPAYGHHRHHRHHHRHHGRTPWCGLYMMKVAGKTDPRLARAREWAREGVDAGGPAPGVIVVWPHHVGRIVGLDRLGQWLVNSGNDGNAVRTRPRSLARAIAFRRL